jgi:hypothetical protein
VDRAATRREKERSDVKSHMDDPPALHRDDRQRRECRPLEAGGNRDHSGDLRNLSDLRTVVNCWFTGKIEGEKVTTESPESSCIPEDQAAAVLKTFEEEG